MLNFDLHSSVLYVRVFDCKNKPQLWNNNSRKGRKIVFYVQHLLLTTFG